MVHAISRVLHHRFFQFLCSSAQSKERNSIIKLSLLNNLLVFIVLHSYISADVPFSSNRVGDTSILHLLLRYTDGFAATAGGLRVLATNTQPEEMSRATMRAHLVQSISILSDLEVHLICDKLRVRPILEILLAI